MTRKVFRAGNSLVISLPREAIEALGVEEGGEVVIDVDHEHRVVVLPGQDRIPGVDEDFARQVAEFIEEYRPALQALADGK